MTDSLPLMVRRPTSEVPTGLRRFAPVLPVVAVVALLALPTSRDGGDTASLADAASGLLVLYAAVRAMRLRHRPLSRAAALLLGLPVVGVAVAALGAPDVASGLSGLVRYLQVFVLVPAAVLLILRDRADFRLLAWTFVALAGWQGGVGVHQYMTGTGASYMGSDIRAVGTFGPTDVMGMATVVAYGLVCAVGLALGTRGPRAARQRNAALLCAALLVVPLALSFSRGAWIATAAACGAQLLLGGARRAVRVLAVLSAVCVVLVGGLGLGTAMLQERLDSITHVTDAPDQSVADRYSMWAAAVDMWRERPLTGVGLKGFPLHRDGHASLSLSSGSDTGGAGAAFRRQPLLSPHNMYLLVLAEQGLIGVVALVGSWAGLLVCGVFVHRRTRAYTVPASAPAGSGTPPAPAGAPGTAPPRRPQGTGTPPAQKGATAGSGAPQGTGAGRRRTGTRRPGGRGPRRPGGRGDLTLIGFGLLAWQLIDFAYADIGGPSTVLTAVVLGAVAWWALRPGPHDDSRADAPEKTSGPENEGTRAARGEEARTS